MHNADGGAGLSMAKLELTRKEMAALEARFQSVDKPGYVMYLAFCNEVEAVFGKADLHVDPLAETKPVSLLSVLHVCMEY